MERTRPTAPPEEAPHDDLGPPALRGARLAETPARPEAGHSVSPGPGAAAGAETVAEAQAREVWRVAARLQAEAARRLDARSQSLADEQRAETTPAAFSRAEVEEIAVSAGIDRSFVALAWREVEAARHQPPVSDDRQRRASGYLGTDAERLSVTRTFRAAPDAVLAAMQRVLPADPYRLTLVDVLGDADDLADTALLFDVPQVWGQVAATNAYTPFSYAMSISDLNRVVVTLHDMGDGRTEATLTADLQYGKDRNLTWAVGSSVVAALVAGALAGVVGLAASGATAAVVAAVLTAVIAGVLTWQFYPSGYRWGLRKGERALGDLLGAVDVDLRSGGAFRPSAAPPASPSGLNELLGG